MCSFIIIKRKTANPIETEPIWKIWGKRRFSILHYTVHIGQELITRSTPFVIHFVMMPNQLSDVGLTGYPSIVKDISTAYD